METLRPIVLLSTLLALAACDDSGSSEPTCAEIAAQITAFEAANSACQETTDCTHIGTIRVEGRNCYVFVNVAFDRATLDDLLDQYSNCSCSPAACPCVPAGQPTCEQHVCREIPPD